MRKGPEFKNGIRDRSLYQQLRGQNRKNDHRTRWQLHLKSERNNQRIRQEGFRNGIRKASKLDVQRVSENKDMDLVEGLTPSKTEKRIVHEVRTGYVGVPATPRVTATTTVREREQRRKTLDCDN
jgi:hypothetical protein